VTATRPGRRGKTGAKPGATMSQFGPSRHFAALWNLVAIGGSAEVAAWLSIAKATLLTQSGH
jgi:hypothetical protein